MRLRMATCAPAHSHVHLCDLSRSGIPSRFRVERFHLDRIIWQAAFTSELLCVWMCIKIKSYRSL